VFTDPQTVTVNAVAKTLPRTATGPGSASVYTLDDGSIKLSISHTVGAKARRVVRLDHRKTAADPLNPTQNRPYTMSTYIVTETPVVGYTVAEAKQIVDALLGFLTASSGAAITKVLGGES